jgi:hypothetical protein
MTKEKVMEALVNIDKLLALREEQTKLLKKLRWTLIYECELETLGIKKDEVEAIVLVEDLPESRKGFNSRLIKIGSHIAGVRVKGGDLIRFLTPVPR